MKMPCPHPRADQRFFQPPALPLTAASSRCPGKSIKPDEACNGVFLMYFPTAQLSADQRQIPPGAEVISWCLMS